MKILYLNSDYNGCSYWRMYEPARFLNMMFKDVSVTYFPNSAYNEKLCSEWERLATSHDIIVAQRCSDVQSLQTFLVVRELSKKPIVVENDDDWQCVDKYSVAYKYWKKGDEDFELAKKQAEVCDIMQVSTFPLKQAMYKFGKPTWVAPNLIDIEKMNSAAILAKANKPDRDHIVIGWAGSATHYGDFLEILPAIKEVADKYPTVKFVFRGMNADFFKEQKAGWAIEGNVRKLYKGCPIDIERIDSGNGCEFWNWPNMIANLDIDFVIVPLKDSKFNKAKSNCRYLEFSSVKTPGIYADVYPYSNTIRNGFDGLLAGNHSQWVDAMSRMIEDRHLRKSLAEAAYKTVEERYSLQNNIGIWKKNYEEIADHISKTPFASYYEEEKCQMQ